MRQPIDLYVKSQLESSSDDFRRNQFWTSCQGINIEREKNFFQEHQLLSAQNQKKKFYTKKKNKIKFNNKYFEHLHFDQKPESKRMSDDFKKMNSYRKTSGEEPNYFLTLTVNNQWDEFEFFLNRHPYYKTIFNGPVDMARLFNHRITLLFEHILFEKKNNSGVFSTDSKYYCKIEEQHGNALHIHIVIWGALINQNNICTSVNYVDPKYPISKQKRKRQIHDCYRGKCLRINKTTGQTYCKNRFPRKPHYHDETCKDQCPIPSRLKKKWIRM